jgi:hypothetical protein
MMSGVPSRAVALRSVTITVNESQRKSAASICGFPANPAVCYHPRRSRIHLGVSL